ncbi:UxaA family hydrolase [Fusobacterium sp. PH5-44]|uniref:UxaA family hydrolase n=1 Tax=unclassified Fusobacterium TaxID=2648384 RepID=UPI003D21F416
MAQSCFQINKADNVVTALDNLTLGRIVIYGEALQENVDIIEQIHVGHKIALVDIPEGTDIIKYGVVIGETIKNINSGEWVHLHNMRSKYDSRSSKLDIVTGAPTDTIYD